jgi:hypothetical protein
LAVAAKEALQVLRKDPSEAAGQVKERFQLMAIAATREPILAT